MQVYKCDDSEDARIHKVLLCLIFLGFARTLILGYGILIQGVQHSFQHQTKGIGRNHET